MPGVQRSRWTINPVIELSGDPTDTAVASRPGGLERSAFIVEKYLLHHLRSYSSLWCWWWRERPRPCGRSCQVTRSPPHPALPFLCLDLPHNLKGVNLSISFTNTAHTKIFLVRISKKHTPMAVQFERLGKRPAHDRSDSRRGVFNIFCNGQSAQT